MEGLRETKGATGRRTREGREKRGRSRRRPPPPALIRLRYATAWTDGGKRSSARERASAMEPNREEEEPEKRELDAGATIFCY
ncbi:hypothetical protein U1Q18_044226 [Sarracenia purpurea var. burkii]